MAFHVAAGSSKKANSSIQMSAEKPRTVSGLPGTAMMREPFSKMMVEDFISAPGASRSTISSAIFTVRNASTWARHFSTASRDWRSEGEAMRKSCFGCMSQSATARIAPVKLLPI